MSGARERTLVERIPGAPEAVRRYYVDFDRIAEVHPLVVAVNTLSHRITDEGYETIYRVKDPIPLRFLSLPITYTATLTVPTAGAGSPSGRGACRAARRYPAPLPAVGQPANLPLSIG